MRRSSVLAPVVALGAILSASFVSDATAQSFFQSLFGLGNAPAAAPRIAPPSRLGAPAHVTPAVQHERSSARAQSRASRDEWAGLQEDRFRVRITAPPVDGQANAHLRAFLAELQRYVPELRGDQLVFGPSGVRAQALARDGSLVDDFVLDRGIGVLHVRNAPSPAATFSLMIGNYIADAVEEQIGSK